MASLNFLSGIFLSFPSCGSAIACKALLYETSRRVRVMVLLNVLAAGWLAACATMYVELRPTPWLPDAVNFAVLDFYAGMSLCGPVVMTLLWMNVFLLPSTTAYVVLGLVRRR